jgi:uncharacterized Zn finger protein
MEDAEFIEIDPPDCGTCGKTIEISAKDFKEHRGQHFEYECEDCGTVIKFFPVQ